MIVSAARQPIAFAPHLHLHMDTSMFCRTCNKHRGSLNVRMMRRTEALASKVGRHVALTGSSQTPLPTSALLLPLLAALGI